MPILTGTRAADNNHAEELSDGAPELGLISMDCSPIAPFKRCRVPFRDIKKFWCSFREFFWSYLQEESRMIIVTEYPNPNDDVSEEEIAEAVQEFEHLDDDGDPDEGAPKAQMPSEDW